MNGSPGSGSRTSGRRRSGLSLLPGNWLGARLVWRGFDCDSVSRLRRRWDCSRRGGSSVMDRAPLNERYAFGRAFTPDVVLDTMRAELHEALAPDAYNREAVMALEAKIIRHLESRYRIDRVNDAALT